MCAVLSEYLPANRALISGNRQYKLSNYALSVLTQFELVRSRNSNNTARNAACANFDSAGAEIGVLVR